jgi:multidrug resistance efflux pump
VTNLLAQLGDYATVGQKLISLVDADSFWIDAYFEETSLGRILEGDPATVKLMSYSQLIRGHVGGVADINIPNAQPDPAGLASVDPVFTWVRLAQRVPVRIHVDQVPDGVRLVAGMTATVQIDPRPGASKR